MISKLKPSENVVIQGWVDSVRAQKAIIFLIIRDRSGKVQVTIKRENTPEIADAVEGLLKDSTVRIEGKVVDAPNVKLGGIEVIPTKLEVTSSALVSPIDDKTGLDLAMDYRWLDLRDKVHYFEFQTRVLKAMRDWFVENEFIEIMTPKLTGNSTEGGAEVFSLKYYNQTAYLTQSPQLFKQMAIAAGFEKVFEIGANYRAEKSYTSRHSTEFFALDVEMGFVKDEHDVMAVEESMLRYIFEKVEMPLASAPFPKISLLESYELLEKERGYIVPKAAKGDLDPEAERLLCEIAKEKWGHDFIFITNFPSSARAFYIQRLDETKPRLTRGFDLLYRGVEITSGGQREHNPERLVNNLAEKGIAEENMKFYIDFFRYGCPPHGGFALGIARLVAKMLDLPSVKDTTFLFRGPDRLSP
ncbi:MAG: aspartate--tRNA(Asn) ligase [Firmicutes bacterium]|nr:aspartate--tRNA(Asn) ligase [Bacillota bacterium]